VEVSGQLYPRGKRPDTHWIGDWVVPGAGLDVMEKRKIACPCRESNMPTELALNKNRNYFVLLLILTLVWAFISYVSILR
jgi:hypothetical protein